MKRFRVFISTCCLGFLLGSLSPAVAQKPELVVQTGHSGKLWSLAFSPDGRTLASGGEDYAGNDFSVKLWDVGNGRQLRALVGHLGVVHSVTFSPDGRTLASGSEDGTVMLWDVATGRLLRTLRGHRLGVRSVAFTRDGRRLASAGDTIKLWDVAGGRELQSLAQDNFQVQCIAFSPDGNTLAAASDEIAAELWDVASGSRIQTLETGKSIGSSRFVAFSPDGRTLASLGPENTIKVWDLTTRRVLHSLHEEGPFSVTFSPDGRMLASAGFSEVLVWDAHRGRRLATLSEKAHGPVTFTPDGHGVANGTSDYSIQLWDLESQIFPEAMDTVLAVAFSPNGRQLASAYKDQSITLWDRATGHELRTLESPDEVKSLAFSPDGSILASGGHTIELWDAETGDEIQTLRDWADSLAFSPDGKRLASGGFESLNLWDVATGKRIQTFHPGSFNDVISLAFSPDGTELASAGANAIQLWDLATGKQLETRPVSRAYSVAFSPDGGTLVSAGKNVQLWSVADGSALGSFPGPAATILSVAFSHDGRMLAFGTDNSTIELWDVASGRHLGTLGRPRAPVYSLAFSPDGKTLVSVGNSVKLWDLSTGRELETLIGKNSLPVDTPEPQTPPENPAKVDSVALSSDGRVLATGGKYPTITLWDTATGRELRTLEASDEGISSLVFSPDGTTLASSGLTDTQLWDVATGHILQTLSNRHGLTESVVFSPDGRILATGGFGTISLWDVASGNELRTLEGDSFEGSCAAFAPDGKTLASSGSSGIKLWDVTKGRILRTLGEDSSIKDLTFSPDGSTLLSRGEDVKLWDLRSGRELNTFTGPAGTVSFSHDRRILAAAKADNTIELWDVYSGGLLRTLGRRRESVYSVSFSPDGKTLVSGSDATNLWDIAGASQSQALARRNLLIANGRELQTLAGHTSQIDAVCLSADGRMLATSLADSKIQLWDLASGKEPRTLPWPASEAQTVSLAFSPDGRTLAGTDGSEVQLWDAVDGHELPSPPSEEFAFKSIAFSSNGQTLALGGHNIRFWEVADGHYLAALAGHTGKGLGSWTPTQTQTLIAPPDKTGEQNVDWSFKIKHIQGFPDERQASVISMAFTSDGHTLATGSDDYTIKLWDLPAGHELRTLAGHSAWVRAVAFSPDGLSLASASDDLTVKLWDVDSGRVLRTMEGHANRVMSVAFSQDGHVLASGSDDGTVILWDVHSGRKLRTLSAQAAVLSVAFRSDGRTLASGDKYAVRLWDTSTGDQSVAIFALDQGAHWLAVNPDGLFDTDDLDEIDGLSWVFPDEPLRALAPEIFMRDYFKPRLLSQLLKGGALPSLRPLHDLNRAQPQVDFLKFEPEAHDGLVSVTVQVASTQSIVQKDSSGKPLESGAYDLHLFRNGQVVAQWPRAATSPGVLPGSSDTEREAWRNLHRINLTEGRYVHTFSHIRLPQRSGVDKVAFTAYVFNSDRVKSRTTPPYEHELVPPSPESVSRRAYLITIGVNANQSHNLDLELAVSSAERVRSLLRAKLQLEYQEVREVRLYSDFEPDSNRLRSKSARKANFKAVLDLLAGRSVDPSLRGEVDPKHQLRAAGPDDAVVVYVASHGYADPQGNFYVVPYDTGQNWGVTENELTRCLTHTDESAQCKQTRDLLAHLISSSDLTAWWNGVDAGEMVMILDSCHSGAAPGKEFRPGPLGDPGLGQLSYDKGMQILSASQPAQTERGEWISGGEGRTLLVDALEAVAKQNPQQSVEQWLHGVEEKLPQTFKQMYPGLKDEDVQLPVLLDFAKKMRTSQPAPCPSSKC